MSSSPIIVFNNEIESLVENDATIYMKLDKNKIDTFEKGSSINATFSNFREKTDYYNVEIHVSSDDYLAYNIAMKSKKKFPLNNHSVISFNIHKINNRGTGGGGKQTNKNGKLFEEKTCIESRLLEQGYESRTVFGKSKAKWNNILIKNFDNGPIKRIFYGKQRTLEKFKIHILKIKTEIPQNEGIEIPKIKSENPDQFIYVEYNGDVIPRLIILEKKYQKSNGSCDEKIRGGPTNRKIYSALFNHSCSVSYGYCLSKYLKRRLDKELYLVKKTITDDNIHILSGDDDDYFIKHEEWIYKEINQNIVDII